MHGLFHLVDADDTTCFECGEDGLLEPVEHRDYGTGIPTIMLRCRRCGKLCAPAQHQSTHHIEEDS